MFVLNTSLARLRVSGMCDGALEVIAVFHTALAPNPILVRGCGREIVFTSLFYRDILFRFYERKIKQRHVTEKLIKCFFYIKKPLTVANTNVI